jgi:hypothetical protein
MSNDEPLITFEEVYPTTLKYQPLHDQHWRIVEAEDVYVARMRAGPLPNWPVEPSWRFHCDSRDFTCPPGSSDCLTPG